MTYYKIIRDGEAVDAAHTFLRWDTRHTCLMACEPEAASYVQSYDGEHVYRVGWLNPLPEGAPVYETVECKIIDEQEYEDLRAVMDEGETVPEPVEPEDGGEVTPPEPEPDVEPEDRPMTVREMREKIAAQEEQIAMLTDCILEMSEIVYGS